jgi:hypothetical protein
VKTSSIAAPLAILLHLLWHAALGADLRLRPLRGQVVSAKTGAPVAGAVIEVEALSARVEADGAGRFRIDLPPGPHGLKVRHSRYRARRLRVVVAAGVDPAPLLVRLDPAAPPAPRARGVRLAEKKYVQARGLSDRYGNALLNGMPLPSSDPDRRAVPLKALPAVLRAGAEVEKVFTPDVPGDFAGGSLRLDARDFPEKLSAKVDVQGGVNSESSFRYNRTYPGGMDYFGFDDGTRALPAAVPSNQAVRVGEGTPPMPREEVAFIGRSFRNIWETRPLRVGMDHGFSASVGGTEHLSGGATFGHLTALSFSKSYRRLISEIANLVVERGQVGARERFIEDEGKESTAWGGFLHLGYRPSARHSLDLLAVYTHETSDTAEVQTGRSESLNLDIQSTRLRYITQSLLFAAIEGRHRGEEARDLRLRWQLHYSRTAQDQPDMRDITYDNPGDGFGLRSIPGSGERFFANLLENGFGTGLDVTVPFGSVRFKTGGMWRFARRAFLARRFWFELLEPAIRFQPPEAIFVPENIGTRVRLDERTLPTDHYDADVQTLAAYAMVDLLATERLRVLAGLRFEYYRQDLVSLNPLVGAPDQVQAARRSDADPLPALVLRYAFSDEMHLSASYGNTVSRPQLREIAPFKFFNFTRQRLDEGNPRLARTYVHNADVRWEWAPHRSIALGVGLFYKYLSDPIERVIFDDRRNITYDNAASAQVYGGEIEATADLGAVHASLKRFTFAAGLTLSDSRVSLKPEQVRIQTSPERPLQGQSPYVIDLTVGYRFERAGARLSARYSVSGPRIVDVGSNFLPDVFEQPFHRVDLRWAQRLGKGWTLTLAGGNVLNQPVSLRGGQVAVLRYRPGADVTATLACAY